MSKSSARSTFGRYLVSKKSVDDRALNAHVLDCMRAELQNRTDASLRVIELGAGLGTMLARLLERGILSRADYTLLDADADLLHEARDWLEAWASATGHRTQASGDGLIILGDRGTAVAARFVHREIEAFLSGSERASAYDLLIANAVLDLVDVESVLPPMLELLVEDGLFWFSLNFDGETILVPEHEHDAAFMAVYHRSMDERVRSGRPAGDSKTGRHLFQHLRSAGATVLGAGSSDWVVFAGQAGYPAHEEEFLRHIVATIDAELKRHSDIDQQALRSWTERRYAQIERGELTYIAHQLDFVGRPQRG